MHASSKSASAPRKARSGTAAALTVGLLALAASLSVPAVASAANATPDTTSPASVTALPAVGVEEVLAGVPLKDLSATQLGALLSQLPALSSFPKGHLQEGLTKSIEALGGEGGMLGQLAGSSELLSKLNGQLGSLLYVVEFELLAALKGQSLSTVLGDALGSQGPSQILGGLLTTTLKPEELIGEVLSKSSPQKLEALLGSKLVAGEPFSLSNVGGLAADFGMTAEGLASDLDKTTTQLPAGVTALTAPLVDGKTLGVLNAVEGLDLALLGHGTTPEGSGGGTGGTGGSGSGGGSGGSGSSGGSGGTGGSTGGAPGGTGGSGGSGGSSPGTPGGTTLILDSSPSQGTVGQGSGAGSASAKLELLSRKVRGDVVTLVVRVPAAGRLTLAGRGVRPLSEQLDRGERVTVRTVLTKAGVASLRKHHHHRLKVELHASFEPLSGSSSAVATTVAFD